MRYPPERLILSQPNGFFQYGLIVIIDFSTFCTIGFSPEQAFLMSDVTKMEIPVKHYEIIEEDFCGGFICSLCGKIETSKGDFLPASTFIYIQHLQTHVNKYHKDHKDYVKYMYSILSFIVERKLKFSKITSYWEGDVWAKVKKMSGIRCVKDEKLFYHSLGKFLGLVKKISTSVKSTNTSRTNSESRGTQTDLIISKKRNYTKEHLLSVMKKVIKDDKKRLFVESIINEEEVNLLWNSIIIACCGIGAKFKLLNKGGVTYSRGFFDQNKTDSYSLVRKMLNVECKFLKTLSLALIAVDNNDVKLPFATKKEHYVAMMQRCVFAILEEDIPRSLNLTELLSGRWKKKLKKSQVNEIVQNFSKLQKNEEKSIQDLLKLYFEAAIFNSLDKMEPFCAEKRTKSFSIRRDEIKDEKSLMQKFELFLKETRVVTRQCLDSRCSSQEEFLGGFKSIISELAPLTGVISLSDQPGHEGSRKVLPSCLVDMHKMKYSLSAAVTSCWELGFNEFQTIFKLTRDTRKVPHGYLKHTCKAFQSYFVVILFLLMQMYFSAKKLEKYESINVGELVKCIWERSCPEFKNDFVNSEIWKEVSDLLCTTLVIPIFFKRSIHSRDWELFCLCKKMMMPVFFRSSHKKYLKGVLEECLDLEYIWSSDLVQVFKSVFVMKTSWNQFSTYDEWYERENKYQKEGLSTNPSSSLLFRSLLGNIIRFIKFVESCDTKHDAKQLLSREEMMNAANRFIPFIQNKVRSRLSFLKNTQIRFLPSSHYVIHTTINGSLCLPRGASLVPVGIQKLHIKDFESFLRNVIENNCD